MTVVQILPLPHSKGVALPYYARPGDAGLDLCAAIDQEVVLRAYQWKLIPCGFAMSLPFGYEAQIRPRSSLALKHGVSVLNTPGTVDAGYRGEVGVILVNYSHEDFRINRGDRIAQMVIARAEQAEVQVVTVLDQSVRGAGGFGSTGI